jgi:flagellar export protein FliJ
MKRFVFRVQAALDLRRKQEDEARRALALARADERQAEDALLRAGRALDDMLQRARTTEAAGDLASSIWHRHWITGQRQRIDRCRQLLVERQHAVAEAAGRAQLARRRAKSLERFKERAWQRHRRQEAREEQKLLDDLGAIRFAIERPRAGGHNR